MTTDQQKQISVLLNEIGKALDVTKTEYEQITTTIKLWVTIWPKIQAL